MRGVPNNYTRRLQRAARKLAHLKNHRAHFVTQLTTLTKFNLFDKEYLYKQVQYKNAQQLSSGRLFEVMFTEIHSMAHSLFFLPKFIA